MLQNDKSYKDEIRNSPYMPGHLQANGVLHSGSAKKNDQSSVTTADILVKGRSSYKENKVVEKRIKPISESVQVPLNLMARSNLYDDHS